MSKLFSRTLFLSLLLCALLCCQSCQQGTQKNGVFQADDQFTALARGFVEKLARGDFDGAVMDFDDRMKNEASADRLKALWNGLNMQLGNYKQLLGVMRAESPPYHLALVRCQFERSPATLRIVFNDNKQISGFFLDQTQ